ncbi:MAG TPA: hypothetical protein VGF13_19785 [Verrucomicrobiae bacterium]
MVAQELIPVVQAIQVPLTLFAFWKILSLYRSQRALEQFGEQLTAVAARIHKAGKTSRFRGNGKSGKRPRDQKHQRPSCDQS